MSEPAYFVPKTNAVVVRDSDGEAVAAIKLVSPAHKNGSQTIGRFAASAIELLNQGVNLLIIDLFPPTPRDPQGLHKAIWDNVRDDPFELPADKRLTLAAYVAGTPATAYVEPVAVGDALPDMPVFLDSSSYVPAPLEPTYQEAWERSPAEFKELVTRQAR